MRRILIASLAAVGVVGLIGGGTFAALTSQEVLEDNTFQGAVVELDLTNNYGAEALPFYADNLVPVPNAGTSVSGLDGQGRQIKYYVLTNDGTINADLSLRIDGIDTAEEDFAEQLFVGNFYHDSLGLEPPANNCSFSGAQYRLVNANDATEEWGKTDYVPLMDVINKTWIFESVNPLAPGDEQCFVMTVYWQDDTLPSVQSFVNNDVMGESAIFDVNFDLVQHAP